MPSRKYEEIAVDCIITTDIQARQENVDVNINDLANSIKIQGLFTPVLLVDAGQGKYELLAGQRRMKAYRDVLAKKYPDEFSKIPAFVYPSMEEWQKRAISINENFTQERLTENDKIAAVTACFNVFDNMVTTATKTGISYENVRRYVKFERLPLCLKKLKDEGKIKLGIALETADLYDFDSSDTKGISEKEITQTALELKNLANGQKKLVKLRVKETKEPPPKVIKEVREKQVEMVKVVTQVTPKIHTRILSFKSEREIPDISLATSELIEDGLEKNDI